MASSGGPIPGSAWEKGRPFWLEGELVPKSLDVGDAFTDVAVLTSERTAFLGTRAVASRDRFAWGHHECTAPSYEQRVIDQETRWIEDNRPPPSSHVSHVLHYWQVRVTCAPGKGDGEVGISRVIEPPGVLEPWFSATAGPFLMRFQPSRD